MLLSQLAEKYFVHAGDPRAAIEMYTKANMYEAVHKVVRLQMLRMGKGGVGQVCGICSLLVA